MPQDASSPYFQRHIFFCLNERASGEACCAQHQAQQGFERCKAQVKALGLAGPGKVLIAEYSRATNSTDSFAPSGRIIELSVERK